MSTSIREQIFQNIKTTIEGINKTKGYNNTIENVFLIHGKRDDAAYKEPIVYVYPGAEVLDPTMGERGRDYFDLSIEIEVLMRSERSEMNASVNGMLADLMQALGGDATRGGLAIDTRFVSNEVIITDLTSDRCAVLLTISVGYEIKYGNPYEQ